MDLDARPYRFFVAVAEHRSFSRAAAELHVSQPALSAQIRELERRIGFALFTRTSRHVDLSPQGLLFLDNARRIILETEWINQAAEDIRTNQLRVGAAHHSALIPERNGLFDRFLLANPRIPMRVDSRSHGQLYPELARQLIDIALTIEPDITASSAVEHGAEDFERLIIDRRPMRLLFPKEHDLARLHEIPRRGLAGVEICTLSRAHGISLSELVARGLSEAGAILRHPPEGDASAIARYGALLRLPAVSVGWFPEPADDGPRTMVARRAADIEFWSSLVVIRSRRPQRPAAELFWRAAEAFASEQPPQAR